MTRFRCGVCGRLTVPFALYVGVAIGPTCARRQGLTPARSRRNSRITFPKRPAPAPAPENLELFPA